MENWIAVADEMPDEGQFVLAFGEAYQGASNGPMMSVAVWADDTWWDCNLDFEISSAPTHWMPLPESPAIELNACGSRRFYLRKPGDLAAALASAKAGDTIQLVDLTSVPTGRKD